jgi:hypothetical protein
MIDMIHGFSLKTVIKDGKQQIELINEQEKERNKFKPTNEFYNMKFDI